MRTPHGLITDRRVSDSGLMLWVLLASYPARQVEVQQSMLARQLGWISATTTRASATRRVRHAIDSLVDAGWLEVEYRRRAGRDVPLYTVMRGATGDLFEKTPRWLLDRITGDALLAADGPALLHHWLYWRCAAGAAGFTEVSFSEMGQRFKPKAEAFQLRRKQLEQAGLVNVLRREGHSSVVRFPDIITTRQPAKPSASESVDSGTSEMFDLEGPTPRTVRHLQPGDLPEQSGTTPPNSPLLVSRPPLDHYEDTPSGPVLDTASSMSGHTATLSPNQDDHSPRKVTNNKREARGDRFAQTAAEWVRNIPQLSALSPTVRGKLRQGIARQLRRTPQRDLAQARTQVATELELLDDMGELETQHMTVIRQVLNRWFADQKAARRPEDQDAATPPDMLSDSVPVQLLPDGPNLEDLAAADVADRRRLAVDPDARVHARSVELASWTLAQLEADPEADIQELLERGRMMLHRVLVNDPAELQLALLFVPAAVHRAYQRSLAEAEAAASADAMMEEDEVQQICAMIQQSLDQAAGMHVMAS